MIKSIGITALAKSNEDFIALVKLLQALGIRTDLEGENKNYRYIDFAADGMALSVVYGDLAGHKYDLFLTVSHPDTAREVVKKLGFKLAEDVSAIDSKQNSKQSLVLC